jgi:hypothetical protein
VDNIYQATWGQVKNVLKDIMGRQATPEEIAGTCMFAMPHIIRHAREGGDLGEVDTIIHHAFANWLRAQAYGH